MQTLSGSRGREGGAGGQDVAGTPGERPRHGAGQTGAAGDHPSGSELQQSAESTSRQIRSLLRRRLDKGTYLAFQRPVASKLKLALSLLS